MHGIALTDNGDGPLALGFRAEGPRVAHLAFTTPASSTEDEFSAWALKLISELCDIEAYSDHGMAPGGWDYLVSEVQHGPQAVATFLDGIVSRWPRVLVEIKKTAANVWAPVAIAEWQSSHVEPVVFMIARDSAMQEHSQETGGAPMPDGDGPLQLYAGREPDGTWAMTLVTPAPAHDDEFSAWAVQLLSDACGRPVTLADDIDKDWPNPYKPEET
jgi:hypothetical protein